MSWITFQSGISLCSSLHRWRRWIRRCLSAALFQSGISLCSSLHNPKRIKAALSAAFLDVSIRHISLCSSLHQVGQRHPERRHRQPGIDVSIRHQPV